MAASRQSKVFTACVYENDYKEMQRLVQLYPEIETGGDLFGLWQDENTVVIQLFIGPGEKSRRTTTSFHQDVEYLGKVGAVITREEGLCNVGEWHSHHQIGMPAPSRQDNQTVLSNMPQLGLDRFVLFIANIKTSSVGKRSLDVQLHDIEINCFVFREGAPRSEQPIKGKIVHIPGANPLQKHNKAQDEIKEGAESEPKPMRRAEDKRRRRTENLPRDENISPNRNMVQARSKEPPNQRQAIHTHPQSPPTQQASSTNIGRITGEGFF